MDSFELTKIAAAILMALLVIFGVRTFIDIRTGGHGGGPELVGYSLPMPAAEAPKTAAQPAAGGAPVAPAAGGAPAAPAAAGFDAAAVVAAVAKADVEAGKSFFKKCTACHTVESGGPNKIGPNLFGIVNRAKGAGVGFAYSDDLKAKGGNWTPADLAAFLHNPKGYLPKTKMVFPGIPNNSDLANLLAYLGTVK